MTPTITHIGSVRRDVSPRHGEDALLVIELHTEMGRMIALRCTFAAARRLLGVLGCSVEGA